MRTWPPSDPRTTTGSAMPDSSFSPPLANWLSFVIQNAAPATAEATTTALPAATMMVPSVLTTLMDSAFLRMSENAKRAEAQNPVPSTATCGGRRMEVGA